MTQHDNETHYVYILRDADGDAHYVGCSHDPTGRWKKHINNFKNGKMRPLYDEMRARCLTFDDWSLELRTTHPDKKQGHAGERRLSEELRTFGADLWQGRDGDEDLPATRAKKSAGKRGNTNGKRISVVYDGTAYSSIAAASVATGVAYLNVQRWSKLGRHGWRRT